jgi:hypothetical protein
MTTYEKFDATRRANLSRHVRDLEAKLAIAESQVALLRGVLERDMVRRGWTPEDAHQMVASRLVRGRVDGLESMK